MSRNALVFFGGWPGHYPQEIAQRYVASLEAADYQVDLSDGLECLDDDVQLRQYDLIVPCVTMAQLAPEREAALSQAIQQGSGIAAAHGSGDAFRGALTYAHILGGQFVSHPYVGEYTVRVTRPDHPLCADLPKSFAYDSEQYYLHTDPGNEVLLATDYDFDGKTIDMPVAWVKNWGKGKVFYCALGHKPSEYDAHPHVWNFIMAGAQWATRQPTERVLTKIDYSR